MSRKLRLAAAITFASVAALSLASPAVEGGRVVGQRTFLWHVGNATGSDLPRDVANPFRGRVAPRCCR